MAEKSGNTDYPYQWVNEILYSDSPEPLDLSNPKVPAITNGYLRTNLMPTSAV